MHLEKFKKIVYKWLVDNNTLVSQSFQNYLEITHVERHYCKKILKLLRLNWRYRICGQKNLDISLSKLHLPEFSVEKRIEIKKILEQMERVDIVSFDIFDTLIFRAVEKPKDVFKLLEAKWHIFGFKKLREEAEQRARKKGEEITIYDIYSILEKEIGIDKQKGVEIEFQIEKEICYANPYMLKIFEEIKRKGKKIIAISDMYFPEKFIRELLISCGYEGIQEVYVSCDKKLGKRNGALQKYVQSKEGVNKSYLHIGDNKTTDIEGSIKAGWQTIYYKNIGLIGQSYRRREMHTLGASIYKGIVNAKLHCGLYEENELYEYGYVNGGIMAVGYCQFLKQLIKKENIDQVLFVARDGYILHKIYQKYDQDIDCKYIPFSRFASYQITMERNWKDFFKQIILPRLSINAMDTLEDILKIGDMDYIRPLLEKYNLKLNEKFSYRIYEKLKVLFEENIEYIIKELDNEVKAAKKYLEKVIGTHKKICVVDIGWQGTGALYLKYFLEEKCNLNIKVCGALMGTANNESSDISISNGDLYSYMFSTQNNKDTLLKMIEKNNEYEFRKLLIEILFTEDKPSFIKYHLKNNDDIELIYGSKDDNSCKIKDIQKGIYDFATDYFKYESKFGSLLNICGQEAYIPIHALGCNKKYCLKLLGDYKMNESAGNFDKNRKRTFLEIVHK